jgi:hypothetical protein
MVTPFKPSGKMVPKSVAVEYKILTKPSSSGDSMMGCKIKTLMNPIMIPV